MKFEDLNLEPEVLQGLDAMNFKEATPVQEATIPVVLDGKDLIACAQTGTGKTAAYILPLLNLLTRRPSEKDLVRAIVIAPTRELAQQIDMQFEGFSYFLPISTFVVAGGGDGAQWDQQKRGLQMGADVMIATPGRLISHLLNTKVDLSGVEYLVLDEADRMLDMGFSEDINTIASKLPKTCQTIMFSATMPEKIEELAKALLKDPVEIKLAVSKPAEKIKQEAYVCYETQKMTIIKDIFKAGDMKRVIVFSGSKMKVKQLAAALQQIGINCGAMHSDLEQAERDDVMFKFKSGQFDVLVATDIVARGIDIDDIEMVINYDVPHDTEDYVHRIGRTARANRDGRAITFVNEEDQYWFQQIEKFLEKVVDKMPLPEGCGEGPEYIKLNKPSKRNNGRKGKGGKQGGNNRNGNRGGNNNSNGEGEGKTKTSAKSRRQKDRDQTSHKRKPNKPNERQEKTPQNNGENGSQKNRENGEQKNREFKNNEQRNAEQRNGEQKNRNNNKRRNNNKQRNNENGNQQGNQQSNGNQRPGNENNVRPGSNGRGRGVAQKKQGGAQQNQQKRQGAAPQNQQKKGSENSGPRKYAPVVNPQKNDNPVKKFIKRIFGFGK